MGRKMKSTKSGKFMNPTDQARKEARKRELKKNKKQRLLVRVAVLKGKDPFQIIADLERLDRMEYDFYNPPPLNEKVLKDKRRKLKETWDRICRLYGKEDKEKLLELKRMENDYEAKRVDMAKAYEAIKSAQEVNLDEIPLPTMMPADEQTTLISNDGVTKHSILKNSKNRRNPPGCPPGLPPKLKEFEIDDSDEDENESDSETTKTKKKRIRFADDDDENSDSGNHLQEFLEEIEQLSGQQQSKSEIIEKKETQSAASEPLLTPVASTSASNFFLNNPPPQISIQPAPPILLSSSVPVAGQSSSSSQNSIQPSNLSSLSAPPPPPPPLLTIGSRPPVTPFQPLPTMILPQPPSVSTNQLINQLPPFLAASVLMNKKLQADKKQPGGKTTIEAKPQLRNLSADATKFLPLTLRIKRDEKPSAVISKKVSSSLHHFSSNHYDLYKSSSRTLHSSFDGDQKQINREQQSSNLPLQQQTNNKNSKDDAYEQFMKEMQNII